MPDFVIWIDRENAKIFEFSREKMQRKFLHSRHQDHHTHAFDGIDLNHQENKFFTEVAGYLSNSNLILILGPGVAKHHFLNYLNEQLPLLAKKVIACETVDHPTDGQIAKLARIFLNYLRK